MYCSEAVLARVVSISAAEGCGSEGSDSEGSGAEGSGAEGSDSEGSDSEAASPPPESSGWPPSSYIGSKAPSGTDPC